MTSAQRPWWRPNPEVTPPAWFTRDLYPGDDAADVDVVQMILRLPRTGVYDAGTAAKVRGFQRLHGLAATGVVDAETAAQLGEVHWFSGHETG